MNSNIVESFDFAKIDDIVDVPTAELAFVSHFPRVRFQRRCIALRLDQTQTTTIQCAIVEGKGAVAAAAALIRRFGHPKRIIEQTVLSITGRVPS